MFAGQKTVQHERIYTMMYGNGFSWLGGAGMMIFWVLILVAVVWGVVYFARKSGQSNAAITHVESPLDVVKRRYAAGEINKEQFEEMKRNLGTQTGS
jgi:putative membrane protein